jgi:hypothetical protein
MMGACWAQTNRGGSSSSLSRPHRRGPDRVRFGRHAYRSATSALTASAVQTGVSGGWPISRSRKSSVLLFFGKRPSLAPLERRANGVDRLGLCSRHAVGETPSSSCRSSEASPIADRPRRSSSLCITRTGTAIFFRSSVRSVCEKATMPSCEM